MNKPIVESSQFSAGPPHAQWPDQARIAVRFVLNYEEGGENSVLHGDAGAATPHASATQVIARALHDLLA